MRYKRLGTSDLTVSEIGLGTMTFGEQTTEKDAVSQLDFAIDVGINFIDTAELYPLPVRKDTYGATEAIVGRWLANRSRRDIVLGTKVIGYEPSYSHIRHGVNSLTPLNIRAALVNSLRRLQTDYVDLFQIHWADRNTNYRGLTNLGPTEDQVVTNIGVVVDTLRTLQIEGKIRNFGISNESSWGLMKYLQFCGRECPGKVVSIQNEYNLLNRKFEDSLAEVCHREKVSLIAYSPLAGGALTGKYSSSGSGGGEGRYEKYKHMTNNSILNSALLGELSSLAVQLDCPLQILAYRFLLEGPYCDVVLFGASKLEQLKENIEYASLDSNKHLTGTIFEHLRPIFLNK